MGRRILVVDDDSEARSLLHDLLTASGYDVTLGADGEDALRLAVQHRPDLIFLDVVMPGPDGFEVCRRLKSTPELRLTPVVLITGLVDRQSRLTGLASGASDFLDKPFDPAELAARTRSLLDLKSRTDELERAESVLLTLGRSIEARDPWTAGHCERLSRRAVALGRRAAFEAGELEALRIAGFVHDIGKVAVPDYILLKAGPLSRHERSIMNRHPVTGESICRPLRTFSHVLPVIRHHHERMDGSGYPDGLRGQAIPRTARAMSIVDVFDALLESRPSKVGLDRTGALQIMQDEVRAGWWDPELFAEFTRMLDAGDDPDGDDPPGPSLAPSL